MYASTAAIEPVQEARRLYDQGQWQQAEQLCLNALSAHADDPEALNLLGLIAAATGRNQQAEQWLCAALSSRPDDAALFNNRGNVLKLMRRFEEALQSYDRALCLRPGFVEAHNNRGATLYELGRFAEALHSLEQALRAEPRFALAHYTKGLVLAALGRSSEAVDSYDAAIRLDSTLIGAHCHRALMLESLKRPDEAAVAYCSALKLAPTCAPALFGLANLMRASGRLVEALELDDRAVAVDPNIAVAHNNRGLTLQALHRLDEALQSFEAGLHLQPNDIHLLVNRGSALREAGRPGEAMSSYDRALALQPESADAYLNRGLLFCELQQPERALLDFDAAVTERPKMATAHWNRAVAQLLAGNYREGWREYEWRWRTNDGGILPGYARFTRPVWLGDEPLAGRRILLHAEQGFGDVLQFCRYVEPVAALGATVFLAVLPPLRRLLSALPGVSKTLTQGDPLPEHDCHCPLMSLPLAFGTTVETIPSRVPYLQADPVLVKSWGERLGSARGLRVGLTWRGGHRPQQPWNWLLNQRRNIALAALASLRHPDIEWVSLCPDTAAEAELRQAIEQRWGGPELRSLAGELHDFADTAAVMMHLDLVLSVDTATVHLAGALGKPVWLLNRFETCWRWLLGREDSPWYPTMRIYRQARSGDWPAVIERVRTDLFARL